MKAYTDMKGSYPARRNPNRRPTHPGALLAELLELQNKSAIARRLDISRPMLHEILAEKRRLSADFAIRFAQLVGTTPELLMALQADFDVWEARQKLHNLKIMPLHESAT